MTTFSANGIGQSVFVFDQEAPIVTVNGIMNRAGVDFSTGGADVTVTGNANKVDVAHSFDSIVRLTGNSNTGSLLISFNSMVFIQGIGNKLQLGAINIVPQNNTTVNVQGINNVINLAFLTTGTVVTDDGQGTRFNVSSNGLTIKDFANDLTGIVHIDPLFGVTPAQAVAAEQPDGSGGTLLSLPSPGTGTALPALTIDFAGDPHVDVSHFA
jgi:hypothetical protein